MIGMFVSVLCCFCIVYNNVCRIYLFSNKEVYLNSVKDAVYIVTVGD